MQLAIYYCSFSSLIIWSILINFCKNYLKSTVVDLSFLVETDCNTDMFILVYYIIQLCQFFRVSFSPKFRTTAIDVWLAISFQEPYSIRGAGHGPGYPGYCHTTNLYYFHLPTSGSVRLWWTTFICMLHILLPIRPDIKPYHGWN